MKAKFLVPASLLALTLSLHAQSGGPFDLSWFTIDGGGGTSSGGAYSLSGTIGQADAGVMSGGAYTLQGGFWGGVVQTEGAPSLRIQLNALGQVIVSWPNPSTGFQLQEAAAFLSGGATWNNVGQVPSVSGGEKQITLAPSAITRFFRLRKP